MKNLNLLPTIFFVGLISFCFSSCGGDDEGNSSVAGDDESSKVIDDVNMDKTKKLVELSFDESTKLSISYDNIGRMSKVMLFSELYESKVLLKIDYDLRVIEFNDEYYYSDSDSFNKCMFSLNNKGYISQIGSCTCTYDSYGYLTGVENSKEIWTLSYQEGELVKSLVNNFTDGPEIYLMFYGENKDSGELLFYMNTEKEKKYIHRSVQAVLCFIAYQAGLFGKITNHCTYLSKSNETAAVFERNNNKNSNITTIKCKFKYEYN